MTNQASVNNEKSKYQISVPFVLSEKSNKEDILRCLQKAEADYVFLSFEDVSASREAYKKTFAPLKEAVPFFKSHGYKVGVWIWSFILHDIVSAGLENELTVRADGSKRMEETKLSTTETGYAGYFCPTYERSSSVMLDVMKTVASYNPDIILFDDDFDYSTHNGCFGCYCDNHLKLISERLGRCLSREQLNRELCEGKSNTTRREWYKLTGETLEAHAARVRQAVDEVNPSIRVGLCSVMSIWGTDGTTAERIAKILAGKTKPFIRLIGAPYWSTAKSWGNRLQNIIELARMEYSWLIDKDGIDVFTEGDVYPRPRYTTPASFLECFDTALRAAGVADGIHKYMFDYTAKGSYEPGYIDRHIRNRQLYSDIDRVFSDKKPVGVRVYEYMDKVSEADVTGIKDAQGYMVDMFHSRAVRLLSDNSLPTTYEEGARVGIAFGENARHLPDTAFEGGLILDIRAARILMEQGVDVGIEKIGEEKLHSLLYFPQEDDCVGTAYSAKAAYSITPKATAETIAFSIDHNGEKHPDVIHYVNQKGTRFLVYSFDAAFTDERRYRNYYTQNQLFSSIEWLTGEKCPVVCKGNPDLYVLCSDNANSRAVGLWNIFPDTVFEPKLTLSEVYRTAEFINCTGILEGNTVTLSDINPYSLAIVNLKK